MKWTRQVIVTLAAAALLALAACSPLLEAASPGQTPSPAVLANTRPGGRFHCCVYGHEGNALVRWLVEPVRNVC